MKNNLNLLLVYLNKVARFLGFKLIRIREPRLYYPDKNKSHHPRIILNKNFNKSFLLNVPVRLGLTSRWFDLSQDTLDPRVGVLKLALDRNLKQDKLHKFLCQNFEIQSKLISPSNAAEMVGINIEEKSNLSSFPYWAIVLPWQDEDIKSKETNFPKSVKNDRLKNGFKINSNDSNEIMKINHSESHESHAKQYIKLIDSINKKGLLNDSNYGYISAFILLEEDNWRWIVGSEGNHRIELASAMGYDKFDILVEGIVRKEDAKWWPNVSNGLYSIDQAERIFDDIFHAKPSYTYSAWCSYFINNVNNK